MKKMVSGNFAGNSCLLLTLVFLSLFTGGCSSTPPKPHPRPLNIEIRAASHTVAQLTIPIYIAPIKEVYDTSLEKDDVDKILKEHANENDLWRTNLSDQSIQIKTNDPIWRNWLGPNLKSAEKLVIIADLPLNYGGANNRRVVVPLDRRLWYDLPDKTLHIRVSENKIEVLDRPAAY